MKHWKLRFHLSDVFFAFTIAAVLLWLCLWSMWDQRERVYLGIWEVTLWLGLVSGKGLWHSMRIAFVQGIAIGCTAVVDFLYFDPAPTATNDPFVLYLGASSLVVLGGISLTGLAMVYADQLTSCFQRFPWLRCQDPRRWKIRLVSVCVSCALLGIALNAFWINSSAAGKGALIAIVGLVVTGTLAGTGTMITLNVAMESGKRLRKSRLWRTNAFTWRLRVAAVGLAIIIVFVCSLAYQRSRPPAWKTRWADGFSPEIAISPEGELFAVGNPPGWNAGFLNVPAGTITTFDWSMLSPLSSCSSTSAFDSIRFLDQGQTLFFAESTVRRGNISRLVTTEIASGRRIQELKPPVTTLRHVRFSTTGDECWTIEAPKEGGPAQVSVWRTSDWQLAKTYPLDLDVNRHDLWFDWSPDSGTFISIDYGTPEVVNVVTKKVETTLASPESGRLGRISPNGQWYAAGQFMWNVATGARYTISCDPQFFPMFSADGKYVFVWKTFYLTHSTGLQSLRHVPLLRHLPVMGHSRLLMYEVSTRRLVTKSSWIRGRGELQAASANGRHVIVSYGDDYLGKFVTILWEPS